MRRTAVIGAMIRPSGAAIFILFLIIQANEIDALVVEEKSPTGDVAQVQIYNGLHLDAEIGLISKQESIYFNKLKQKSFSDYKSVPIAEKWNITMKQKETQLLKTGVEFPVHKKVMLVIYNDSAQVSFLLLNTGNMKKELSSKKKSSPLGVDEAFLTVTSKIVGDNLTVYWRSQNCYKCLDQELMTVHSNSSNAAKIGTKWPVDIMVVSDHGKSCNFSAHYGEHGEYEIIAANPSAELLCIHFAVKQHDSTYSPIVIMFGAFAGLIVLYLLWLHVCWNRYIRKKEYELSHELGKPRNFLSSGTQAASVTSESLRQGDQMAAKTKKRLKSLDAFRGVAISIMIFVNYQGGDYHFFEHSLWNGLTVADLVFPWFIFIMGTSIDLSQRSLLSKGIRKQTVFSKIVVRSLKLFAIGLFLNNGKDLQNWRIPGVLQRFAISYFVVAAVSLFMSPSEESQDSKRRFDWTDHVRDIWFFWAQWLLMFVILGVYLLVTFVFHEKGCPKGYLGPGGIGDYGKHPNCTGGAAGYIDRSIFGTHHMYNHPTCKKLYLTTVPYDPEGILGCLTSIFLTYLGLHSGRILFTHSSPYGRIIRWLCCGAFWGLLAVALSGGTKNDGIIPINKNLWSPSFVFANAAMAYILLAVMFFIIDVKVWWNGAPFTFAGMNAILLYCGHEVFHNFFPFNFVANPATHGTVLARSAVGVSLWVIVAFYLYTEQIFFKV